MESTAFCLVHVRGELMLQLSVRREGADVWRWTILINDDEILEHGTMPTKTAAQVASQVLLENCLKRTKRTRFDGAEYQWKDGHRY